MSSSYLLHGKETPVSEGTLPLNHALHAAVPTAYPEISFLSLGLIINFPGNCPITAT